MNFRLSPHEQAEAIKYAAVGTGMILTYIFLWRKQRPLAVIILLGFSCYILANTFEWDTFRHYFFVNWGSGGIAK